MRLINSVCYQALIQYLEAETPDLVRTCQWLACGPTMATVVLGEDIRRPTDEDVADLERELANAPATAAYAGRELFAARARLRAEATAALEFLLAAGEDDWSHPTQILGRRCPDFAEILDVCEDHMETVGGAGSLLEDVAEKLERAARIEAKALKRRGRWA